MSELTRRGFLKGIAGLVAASAAPSVTAKVAEAIEAAAPPTYENLWAVTGYDECEHFVWVRVSVTVDGDEYHNVYRKDLDMGDDVRAECAALEAFATKHMVGA